VKVTLATRGSQLALWQERATRERLRALEDAPTVDKLVVESSGDRDQTSDLARFGRIGIFTVEVDRALLDGRAEVGVHSLKDMTTTPEEGIVLAAVLPRGPVEDVLVTPDGVSLAALPLGSRVATGSMRRAAMVRYVRPDLHISSIRGNVETRLLKLNEGAAHGLILARAGLVRLGLDDRISEVLDVDRFLPAVGQGIVGLTCRAEDTETRALLERISDPDAWAAALAERALLRGIKGGCNVPAGGHATLSGDELTITSRVLSIDGREAVESTLRGARADAEALGAQLADEMLAMGAGELVEAARS